MGSLSVSDWLGCLVASALVHRKMKRGTDGVAADSVKMDLPLCPRANVDLAAGSCPDSGESGKTEAPGIISS